MKKIFCKVRREHWFSLVWVVSFLLWGNVAMAALPIQEARFSMQQHSVAFEPGFFMRLKSRPVTLSLFAIMISI